MKSVSEARRSACQVFIGVALAWAPLALAGALPPEQQAGPVAYISGGIGESEVAAMKAAEGRYPLSLLFVQNEAGRGAYLADVGVEIRDSRGNKVLATTSQGPFLLARLPAGRYTVVASHDQVRRTQQVTVADPGHQRIVFSW